MKQFAIALAALLATSASAQRPQPDEDEERPFVMKVLYDSPENAFLGLELGNPATLILPKAFGRDCSGWQLADNSLSYADFAINEVDIEVGQRGKTITTFEFVADDASGAEADVLFDNTCSEYDDATGEYAQRLSVKVMVSETMTMLGNF